MGIGDLSVVILCGGKGTRAYPHTAEIPKPLITVGDRPVLRHVMDIFTIQGAGHFVLAAGFRADLISEFAASVSGDGGDVQVSDAGVDAGTAERVWAARESLTDPFFVTYGDGVGDVDVEQLLAFHRRHAGSATLTTVPLRSQYGTVVSGDDGRVACFEEKPILADHWVNGGFFVFDRELFDHWPGRDLEREVLPGLAARGVLYSYRHESFWRSVDTYKDVLELGELAADGHPPWIPLRSAR